MGQTQIHRPNRWIRYCSQLQRARVYGGHRCSPRGLWAMLRPIQGCAHVAQKALEYVTTGKMTRATIKGVEAEVFEPCFERVGLRSVSRMLGTNMFFLADLSLVGRGCPAKVSNASGNPDEWRCRSDGVEHLSYGEASPKARATWVPLRSSVTAQRTLKRIGVRASVDETIACGHQRFGPSARTRGRPTRWPVKRIGVGR